MTHPENTVQPSTSPHNQIARGEFVYDNPRSEDYVVPLDSEGMLRAIVHRYFLALPDTLRRTQLRHAAMTARDSTTPPSQPRATIAIPIAVHNELMSTIHHTLVELSQQRGIDQDQIVLYGNMPDSIDQAEKTAAIDRFDAMLKQFRRVHPSLTVRSVTEVYPTGLAATQSLCMGRVRHDYMNLIAWDAIQRGLPVDHPVIMLDADTLKMTPDTIERLARLLRATDSPYTMLHAEIGYLFGDSIHLSHSMLSEPTKLAILQEIRRRQFHRLTALHEPRSDGLYEGLTDYDEEWGTAITLGACMLAGNYKDTENLDENVHLQRRMEPTAITNALMRYVKPGIKIDAPAIFMYAPDITVRSSGRRSVQFVEMIIKQTAQKYEQGIPIIHEWDITALRDYSNTFGHTNAVRTGAVHTATVFDKPYYPDVYAILLDEYRSPRRYDSQTDTFRRIPMPDLAGILQRLAIPQPKTLDVTLATP